MKRNGTLTEFHRAKGTMGEVDAFETLTSNNQNALDLKIFHEEAVFCMDSFTR